MVESNTLINKNDYDTENKLPLKAKEIYDKIVAERRNEINTLNNKIEYDKLTFHFKRKDRIPINFKDFDRPLGLIRKIKDGCIDLKKAKENPKKLRKKIWVKQKEENGSINHKKTKMKNNLKIF